MVAAGGGVGEWDFQCMHTVLLKYKGVPVLSGLVRVLGPNLAELPLIATRMDARRQGHCRVLLHALEAMLVAMGVRVLALPATADAVGQACRSPRAVPCWGASASSGCTILLWTCGAGCVPMLLILTAWSDTLGGGIRVADAPPMRVVPQVAAWSRMGFEQMTDVDASIARRECRMLVFPGTRLMLKKLIPVSVPQVGLRQGART